MTNPEEHEPNTYLNDSMTKLSDSLSQYAATALINLKLPSFGGLPGEDVNQFIKDFKNSTITINDELKCLALNRSLIGSAHIWAKNNIKNAIKKGDWGEVKSKLRERFVQPDESIRHLNKLSKMSYNPLNTTLSSYVDVFADLYKKAHKSATDHDIIRALHLNFPADILKHLNTLAEGWINLSSLGSFMLIVQRLERDILPYEPKPKPEDSNDIVNLTKAIKELQDAVKAKQHSEDSRPEAVEVVAAVNRREQDNKRTYHDRGRQSRDYDDHKKRRFNQGDKPNQPSTNYNSKPDNYRENLQRNYEGQHGKPPGPCRVCGELHFHRHCPFQALN